MNVNTNLLLLLFKSRVLKKILQPVVEKKKFAALKYQNVHTNTPTETPIHTYKLDFWVFEKRKTTKKIYIYIYISFAFQT